MYKQSTHNYIERVFSIFITKCNIRVFTVINYDIPSSFVLSRHLKGKNALIHVRKNVKVFCTRMFVLFKTIIQLFLNNKKYIKVHFPMENRSEIRKYY